jgi:hypothetical protein
MATEKPMSKGPKTNKEIAGGVSRITLSMIEQIGPNLSLIRRDQQGGGSVRSCRSGSTEQPTTARHAKGGHARSNGVLGYFEAGGRASVGAFVCSP